MAMAAFALVIAALLASASASFATSAVDQYSEGIPTAGGQKPSHDAARDALRGGGGGRRTGGGGGSAAIPRTAAAQLGKSKQGSAAERAAKITAPDRSSPGGSTTNGRGMGLILPLILAAILAGAIALFIARRRAGPSSA
jgi:hypothetical protein